MRSEWPGRRVSKCSFRPRSSSRLSSRQQSVESCRIDKPTYCRHTICPDATLACVLPDGFLVGRDVDAIYLVLCNVAVQPLDTGSHILQSFKRLQRDLPDLILCQ